MLAYKYYFIIEFLISFFQGGSTFEQQYELSQSQTNVDLFNFIAI